MNTLQDLEKIFNPIIGSPRFIRGIISLYYTYFPLYCTFILVVEKFLSDKKFLFNIIFPMENLPFNIKIVYIILGSWKISLSIYLRVHPAPYLDWMFVFFFKRTILVWDYETFLCPIILCHPTWPCRLNGSIFVNILLPTCTLKQYS